MPIGNFAYPYGDISFAASAISALQFLPRDDARRECRCRRSRRVEIQRLEQASISRQGVSQLIAETVRRNGWLLFASHDVNDTPSQYGVRPEFLTFALRSALAAGCRLVTVAQALRIARRRAERGGGVT